MKPVSLFHWKKLIFFHSVIVLLSLLVSPTISQGAITRGGTITTWFTSSNTTSVSQSHTVDAGTSLLILVISAEAFVSMTTQPVWNGSESMTLIHKAGGTIYEDMTNWVYGLVNPTATTANITYTLSSNDNGHFTAINYLGTETTSVAAAATYVAAQDNTGATSSTQVTYSTTTDTLFFAGAFYGADGSPASNNQGFAELADTASGGNVLLDIAFYVADLIGGGTGGTITVSWGASDENVGQVITINESTVTPITCDYTVDGTSISTAVTSASAGQVVCVRYASGYNYGTFTPKNGVIVTAHPDDLSTNYPVITGCSGVCGMDYSGSYSQEAVVQGFDIDASSCRMGVCFQASSSNNNAILKDSIVRNAPVVGIYATNGAVIDGCEITGNGGTATSGQMGAGIGANFSAQWTGNIGQDQNYPMIIRNNKIHDNNPNSGGIRVRNDSGNTAPGYILIQGNDIYNSGQGGIQLSASNASYPLYAVITGNNIYNNDMGGIAAVQTPTADAGTTTGAVYGKIDVSGEPNWQIATGMSGTDGTPNEIYGNGGGGIRIGNRMQEMNIIKNKIYLNSRAGIKTGDYQANDAGFVGTPSSSYVVLNIRKNYVYSNGQEGGNYGGGIDVRHAAGTIENNVVYKNRFGAIRFGDYLTVLRNNTVVSNGIRPVSVNGVDWLGGGIEHDNNFTGNVFHTPSGSRGQFSIVNNVTNLNARAGIRDGYCHTVSASMALRFNSSRDYNLLYANNWHPNLWLPYPQLGACMPSANEIFQDPLFVDSANDDYRLSGSSPGVNAGSDSSDMGAWGGTYPMDF